MITDLKVFCAFAGYNSQAVALDRLKERHPEFNYELVGWSEIDRYAITAHNALYPQYADRNFGDITQIDWDKVPDFDLFTYSFPCQSISSAGLQHGFTEGSNTRSSLLWECRKAIIAKKPMYLLMENVKALLQKKFKPTFLKWCAELESYGYKNFYQVMNVKDYGTPQNRERVFMVSIRDENAQYEFPKPFPLEKRLKDVLDKDVPESYYLKPEQVARIVSHCDRKVAEGCGFKTNFQTQDGISGAIKTKEGSREYDTYLKEPKIVGYTRERVGKGKVIGYHLKDTANTLNTSSPGGNTSMYLAEPRIEQVGNLRESNNFDNPQCGRVYSDNGIAPTLNTCGGQREPKILITPPK